MKTPTDVFNTMQVILSDLHDLKIHLAITAPPPEVDVETGKNPKDLFQKALEIQTELVGLAKSMKLTPPPISSEPEHLHPRDIARSLNVVGQLLLLIKRRLGVGNMTSPKRTALRVAPSHLVSEAEKILIELRRVRGKLG